MKNLIGMQWGELTGEEKEELISILKDAYTTLSNKNWYGFGIGQMKNNNDLYWYEIAGDDEIESNIYNSKATNICTIYNTELIDLEQYAKKYLYDEECVSEEVINNKNIVKKIYETFYKNDYENIEEYIEYDGLFSYEQLEIVNPDLFNKILDETKEMLKEEVEKNNNFLNSTIERKAEYIINSISCLE